MAGDIFLSVGTPANKTHADFVREIRDYLTEHELTPHTVGQDSWASNQPLKFVRELMEQCDGTVVIAFERTHIEKGTERRGGGEKEENLAGKNITTVWNHIEAAMAYTHDHPLLVIAEHGLKGEGLIESKYDWYVQWVDLDLGTLKTPKFRQIFADWKRRVDRHRDERQKGTKSHDPSLDPSRITLGRLMKDLTTPELIGVISALAAVFGAGVALGKLF